MTAEMRRDAARGYLAGSEYREKVKKFISSVSDEFDVSESDLYDLFYGYEESTYG
jgi:AraC-like DNA-binding protein